MSRLWKRIILPNKYFEPLHHVTYHTLKVASDSSTVPGTVQAQCLVLCKHRPSLVKAVSHADVLLITTYV